MKSHGRMAHGRVIPLKVQEVVPVDLVVVQAEVLAVLVVLEVLAQINLKYTLTEWIAEYLKQHNLLRTQPSSFIPDMEAMVTKFGGTNKYSTTTLK